MPEFTARVEIPKIFPHQDKYPTVHKTFEALKIGEKMELINDHDVQPILKHKFPLDFPEQFAWTYLEEGPEVWRVAITKIK